MHSNDLVKFLADSASEAMDRASLEEAAELMNLGARIAERARQAQVIVEAEIREAA